MRIYEYIEVREGEVGPTLEEEINKLGAEGWRLTTINIADGYRPIAFMERENDSSRTNIK